MTHTDVPEWFKKLKKFDVIILKDRSGWTQSVPKDGSIAIVKEKSFEGYKRWYVPVWFFDKPETMKSGFVGNFFRFEKHNFTKEKIKQIQEKAKSLLMIEEL